MNLSMKPYRDNDKIMTSDKDNNATCFQRFLTEKDVCEIQNQRSIWLSFLSEDWSLDLVEKCMARLRSLKDKIDIVGRNPSLSESREQRKMYRNEVRDGMKTKSKRRMNYQSKLSHTGENPTQREVVGMNNLEIINTSIKPEAMCDYNWRHVLMSQTGEIKHTTPMTKTHLEKIQTHKTGRLKKVDLDMTINDDENEGFVKDEKSPSIPYWFKDLFKEQRDVTTLTITRPEYDCRKETSFESDPLLSTPTEITLRLLFDTGTSKGRWCLLVTERRFTTRSVKEKQEHIDAGNSSSTPNGQPAVRNELDFNRDTTQSRRQDSPGHTKDTMIGNSYPLTGALQEESRKSHDHFRNRATIFGQESKPVKRKKNRVNNFLNKTLDSKSKDRSSIHKCSLDSVYNEQDVRNVTVNNKNRFIRSVKEWIGKRLKLVGHQKKDNPCSVSAKSKHMCDSSKNKGVFKKGKNTRVSHCENRLHGISHKQDRGKHITEHTLAMLNTNTNASEDSTNILQTIPINPDQTLKSDDPKRDESYPPANRVTYLEFANNTVYTADGNKLDSNSKDKTNLVDKIRVPDANTPLKCHRTTRWCSGRPNELKRAKYYKSVVRNYVYHDYVATSRDRVGRKVKRTFNCRLTGFTHGMRIFIGERLKSFTTEDIPAAPRKSQEIALINSNIELRNDIKCPSLNYLNDCDKKWRGCINDTETSLLHSVYDAVDNREFPSRGHSHHRCWRLPSEAVLAFLSFGLGIYKDRMYVIIDEANMNKDPARALSDLVENIQECVDLCERFCVTSVSFPSKLGDVVQDRTENLGVNHGKKSKLKTHEDMVKPTTGHIRTKEYSTKTYSYSNKNDGVASSDKHAIRTHVAEDFRMDSRLNPEKSVDIRLQQSKPPSPLSISLCVSNEFSGTQSHPIPSNVDLQAREKLDDIQTRSSQLRRCCQQPGDVPLCPSYYSQCKTHTANYSFLNHHKAPIKYHAGRKELARDNDKDRTDGELDIRNADDIDVLEINQNRSHNPSEEFQASAQQLVHYWDRFKTFIRGFFDRDGNSEPPREDGLNQINNYDRQNPSTRQPTPLVECLAIDHTNCLSGRTFKSDGRGRPPLQSSTYPCSNCCAQQYQFNRPDPCTRNRTHEYQYGRLNTCPHIQSEINSCYTKEMLRSTGNLQNLMSKSQKPQNEMAFQKQQSHHTLHGTQDRQTTSVETGTVSKLLHSRANKKRQTNRLKNYSKVFTKYDRTESLQPETNRVICSPFLSTCEKSPQDLQECNHKLLEEINKIAEISKQYVDEEIMKLKCTLMSRCNTKTPDMSHCCDKYPDYSSILDEAIDKQCENSGSFYSPVQHECLPKRRQIQGRLRSKLKDNNTQTENYENLYVMKKGKWITKGKETSPQPFRSSQNMNSYSTPLSLSTKGTPPYKTDINTRRSRSHIKALYGTLHRRSVGSYCNLCRTKETCTPNRCNNQLSCPGYGMDNDDRICAGNMRSDFSTTNRFAMSKTTQDSERLSVMIDRECLNNSYSNNNSNNNSNSNALCNVNQDNAGSTTRKKECKHHQAKHSKDHHARVKELIRGQPFEKLDPDTSNTRGSCAITLDEDDSLRSVSLHYNRTARSIQQRLREKTNVWGNYRSMVKMEMRYENDDGRSCCGFDDGGLSHVTDFWRSRWSIGSVGQTKTFLSSSANNQSLLNDTTSGFKGNFEIRKAADCPKDESTLKRVQKDNDKNKCFIDDKPVPPKITFEHCCGSKEVIESNPCLQDYTVIDFDEGDTTSDSHSWDCRDSCGKDLNNLHNNEISVKNKALKRIDFGKIELDDLDSVRMDGHRAGVGADLLLPRRWSGGQSSSESKDVSLASTYGIEDIPLDSECHSNNVPRKDKRYVTGELSQSKQCIRTARKEKQGKTLDIVWKIKQGKTPDIVLENKTGTRYIEICTERKATGSRRVPASCRRGHENVGQNIFLHEDTCCKSEEQHDNENSDMTTEFSLCLYDVDSSTIQSGTNGSLKTTDIVTRMAKEEERLVDTAYNPFHLKPEKDAIVTTLGKTSTSLRHQTSNKMERKTCLKGNKEFARTSRVTNSPVENDGTLNWEDDQKVDVYNRKQQRKNNVISPEETGFMKEIKSTNNIDMLRFKVPTSSSDVGVRETNHDALPESCDVICLAGIAEVVDCSQFKVVIEGVHAGTSSEVVSSSSHDKPSCFGTSPSRMYALPFRLVLKSSSPVSQETSSESTPVIDGFYFRKLDKSDQYVRWHVFKE